MSGDDAATQYIPISHYCIVEKLGGWGNGCGVQKGRYRLHRFVALRFVHETWRKTRKYWNVSAEIGVLRPLKNPNLGFSCPRKKVPRFDGTWG